ncbi:hypothetical protein L9W80_05540 [Vibrio aestuarianus]|uniref:hypothetical protein n=1 Tax=Vibrio aestuarianus TaxID=28171 RepID=UPI00237CE10A|nr:hypothetical protein [Vibrio aestuarianus]MDE1349615.1 hypothetical protein [Vibrio aestuarianus]
MEEIQEDLAKIRSGLDFTKTQLMPAINEIEYINEQTEILFEDANENTRILSKVLKKSDRKRELVTRNSIRSSCACVEGFAYVLKNALQLTLEHTPEGTYTPKQLNFLQSEYSNGSGAENYKDALKCFARKYNVDVSRMFGSEEFTNLKSVFSLRNRLMHPKSAADLHVTIDDAILLSTSICWFIESQRNVFNQVFRDIEKQAGEVFSL